MLQQHPSPARLGLITTNPNSPSLPPASAATAAAATTTITTSATTAATSIPKPPPPAAARLSPSLLPLLPPLPRAHSLLLQLSSLASRLLEPLPTSFLPNPPSPLPSYPLLPTPPPPPLRPSALHAQLLPALHDLDSILRSRDSAASLSRHISSFDASLLAFSRKMADALLLLDRLLLDYSHLRRPSKRLKTSPSSFSPSPLPLSDLLSYAHRISYTTFAPPDFATGAAPLRAALPPAPQDEQMRASQLYHLAPPDVAVDAGDRRPETLIEGLIQPTPPREEQQPPQPPAVPAGWRKGMPIDLPKDLPPLPPGWKPGDPIQLLPMEEQRMVLPPTAASGAALPRQPETIQVKYVQLDINPEDEYSSDYSSDGSSEEEDED